ncbi:phage integrase SAM-like domain-containing protein, partial [Pedobacter sp. JCM 36344]|uniref:phage integrase SAM-like domain-containing protein n=1 Tax=Pedobacter sp. JCM 36344 TaxID=3374280 RepID=UPI00397CA2B3
EVEKINHAFITGYDFYLRTVQKCSGVPVAKYMKHFRKIINLCLAHKWIVDTTLAKQPVSGISAELGAKINANSYNESCSVFSIMIKVGLRAYLKKLLFLR